MRRLVVLLIAVSASFGLSSQLHGQVVGGVPGGGALSPWLNLYQRNAGPVDNYHMYVQPAQQLKNALQLQQYGIQRNAAAINSVSDQFSSQQEAYYAPGSPTGNAATFMNYGRYFANNSGGGGGGGTGVFGMPGTGGLGRPGGVGQFGTPGLGGAAPGGMAMPQPGRTAAGMVH